MHGSTDFDTNTVESEFQLYPNSATTKNKDLAKKEEEKLNIPSEKKKINRMNMKTTFLLYNNLIKMLYLQYFYNKSQVISYY